MAAFPSLNPCAAAAQEQANSSTAKQQRPPNIVFILADDLGWTDIACQGSKFYETPHIDRLAAQGMRFTSYCVSPNCAPTRAALLTGMYAPRTGVYTVNNLDRGVAGRRKLVPPQNVTNLPKSAVTIAQTLKGAGYQTAHFGKWHLGNGPGYHPSARGFDEAIASNGRHFNFTTNPPMKVDPNVYLADFLTDKAVEFIDKNRERPFFLYVPHFAVHSPYQAKPNLISRFKDKKPVGGHHDPTYAAMIASVDESVGRITKKLEEAGLSENTVVIFSSDNGGVGGYASAGLRGMRGITDNAPLRGGKGTFYEGGIRVPFIIRWPGKVKPGTVSDALAAHVDVFPTFTEIAGAKATGTLDGVSLLPTLTSEGRTAPNRDAIYWHFPGYLEGRDSQWRTTPVSVVRQGDLKLLEFLEDNRLELYNVREDIGEKNNLAEKMPEKARDLHAKLVAWRKAVNAPMLAANPAYDPNAPAPQGNGGGRRRNRANRGAGNP